MTLAEIRTMRATCRAKVEDLLGRTASREMSTEENQIFTDLRPKASGLALWGKSRYAVLESFDTNTTQPIIHRPIAPTETAPKLERYRKSQGWRPGLGNGNLKKES